MKAIYYTVTFLAALVVLAFAGWQAYLHKDVIVGNVPGIVGKKCGCNADCKCTKAECKCSAENSCSPDCDCVKAAAPACCEPKKK
jgi:hypothetical protein